MKKVLIGVGIGCGTLVLAGVALAIVGGFWAKKNLGNVAAMGEEMKAQEAQFQKLEQEYPFTPPTADRPVTLTEDRLRAYLAVRDRALPLHRDFEAKAEALRAKNQGQEKPDLSATLEAANLIAGLMSSVRKAYLEGLGEQHMSPREFGAITTSLYMWEATKDMARQPGAKVEPALTANADLLSKYKDQIEKGANPGFDMWVAAAGMGAGMGGMPTEEGEQGEQHDAEAR